MARSRLVLLAAAASAACVAAAAAGCGGGGGHTSAPARSPTAAHRDPAGATPQPVPLPRMSPAQLAGQRVIYSYAGLTPPASLLRWVRHGEVGGVIFFAANIASRTQLTSVVAELNRANASPRNPLRALPLLLMTDQEGGVVRRMPGPPRLAQKQIGGAAQPAAAARLAGAAAGRYLARSGLNVNLAPVLDVYSAPGGFDDQFGRSYGTSPLAVARLGRDFITAQQAAGVAATGKHFPGLGAATAAQDTDTTPVTLDVPRHRLRTVDELPYRAAIGAGLKLIMLSWAVYPALDPRLPAGLSRAIVGGELRKRLGFTGVTITDALEAGALARFGNIGRRARLAARAGMDLILCSAQDPAEGRQARIALADGYRSGALSRAAFTAALQRATALRSTLRR